MNPVLNRRRENPWAYLIVPILVLNLVAFAVSPALALVGVPPPFWVQVVSALGLWGFALFAIYKLKREGYSISKLIAPGGNPLKFKWKSVLIVFVLVNLIYAAHMALVFLLYGRAPVFGAVSDWQRLILVVVLPVSFGYTEELYWRGFVMTRLHTNGFAPLAAVLVSAAAGALARGLFFPAQLVPAFLLGIVTGVYYARERNLIPLMFTHALVEAWMLGLCFT